MSECLWLFASVYRNAFEEMREQYPDDFFLGNFPNRCCSLASEIMCDKLNELGWDATRVGGVRLNGEGSHSWVVCEGVVIDITINQFSEDLPSVYVGEGMTLHDEYENEALEVRLDCYESELIKKIEVHTESLLDESDFHNSC